MKQLIQKLIMLKKLEHLLPLSKIRIDKVDASITSINTQDEIVNTVQESRTTLVSNRPNKLRNKKIAKPSEVIIPKNNLYVYVLTGLGLTLAIIRSEKKCISRKSKSK